MNGDGLAPGPSDPEIEDAIYALAPLVRISVRLVPIERDPGDSWPLVVGLEIAQDGLPHGLTTHQVFELVHRSLPRLERDARRRWAADR